MAGRSSVMNSGSATARGGEQHGGSSVVFAKRRKVLRLCLGAGPAEDKEGLCRRMWKRDGGHGRGNGGRCGQSRPAATAAGWRSRWPGVVRVKRWGVRSSWAQVGLGPVERRGGTHNGTGSAQLTFFQYSHNFPIHPNVPTLKNIKHNFKKSKEILKWHCDRLLENGQLSCLFQLLDPFGFGIIKFRRKSNLNFIWILKGSTLLGKIS
jgi:hypothetical protein